MQKQESIACGVHFKKTKEHKTKKEENVLYNNYLSSNFLFLSRYRCLASSTCSSLDSAGGFCEGGCCCCSLSSKAIEVEVEEDGATAAVVMGWSGGTLVLSEADSDSLQLNIYIHTYIHTYIHSITLIHMHICTVCMSHVRTLMPVYVLYNMHLYMY